MMKIFLFLLITLIYLASVAGGAFLLYVSTQSGQWLGRWQQVLRRWDIAGKQFLFKIGGGCELCYSHTIAQLSFWPYLAICFHLGIWPLNIWCSVIWLGVYAALSTNMSLLVITKLYGK